MVVVLPTPPFWLATAMIRGSGRSARTTGSSVGRRPAPALGRRRQRHRRLGHRRPPSRRVGRRDRDRRGRRRCSVGGAADRRVDGGTASVGDSLRCGRAASSGKLIAAVRSSAQAAPGSDRPRQPDAASSRTPVEHAPMFHVEHRADVAVDGDVPRGTSSAAHTSHAGDPGASATSTPRSSAAASAGQRSPAASAAR